MFGLGLVVIISPLLFMTMMSVHDAEAGPATSWPGWPPGCNANRECGTRQNPSTVCCPTYFCNAPSFFGRCNPSRSTPWIGPLTPHVPIRPCFGGPCRDDEGDEGDYNLEEGNGAGAEDKEGKDTEAEADKNGKENGKFGGSANKIVEAPSKLKESETNKKGGTKVGAPRLRPAPKVKSG